MKNNMLKRWMYKRYKKTNGNTEVEYHNWKLFGNAKIQFTNYDIFRAIGKTFLALFFIIGMIIKFNSFMFNYIIPSYQSLQQVLINQPIIITKIDTLQARQNRVIATIAGLAKQDTILIEENQKEDKMIHNIDSSLFNHLRKRSIKNGNN